MTWKIVQLELARSPEFPKGSASRAFILRVPLDAEGRIDHDLLAQSPSRATARRFWSADPDQFGHVERCCDSHWLLRCRGPHGETVYRMPALPLRVDNEVIIEEPNGSSNSFRVASIRGNAQSIAVAS